MAADAKFEPFGRPLDKKINDPLTQTIIFNHPEEITGWIDKAKQEFPAVESSQLAETISQEIKLATQGYEELESQNPTAVEQAVEQERSEVWSKGQGRSKDPSVQRAISLRNKILRFRKMEKALSEEKLAA